MTRTLTTGDVHVELGDGAVTVGWSGSGISAGPLSPRVHLGGRAVRAEGAPGAWRVEGGDAYGRPGAWARWRSTDGVLALAVHVPAEGRALVIETGYRAPEDARLDRIIPAGGLVDLGVPPAQKRRLVNGYDSWAYAGVRGAASLGVSWWNAAFARADGTGAFAVQALDADRFATAVASRPEAGRLLVEPSCGATPPLEPVPGTWGYQTLPPPGLGLAVPAGAEERAPPLALAAGPDALALIAELAALAGRVSRARSWSGLPIAGWESWYHYGLVVSPDHVLDNAALLRDRYRTRAGFDLVQVDDGWQVTYGAWLPNERFPEDLGELTTELRARGARPGLWLAPFMVQPGAPGLAADHPDWMVRDDEGEPVRDRHGRWAVDASHPDALAWLTRLGEQVRAWGFEMVKLDFLYLGALEGARHDGRVTGTEALRRGLGAMVRGLGDGTYVLGCGMPLLPAVGLCHGNRVGHDLAVPVLLRQFGQPLREGWTGFHGIRPQARNVAARYALHRRWFDADPDVVMAWGQDGKTADGYSTEEARTLATLAALSGGPFFLADDLARLSDEERAVVEHAPLLDLAGGDGFVPVDLFEHADDPEIEEFFAQTEPPSVWLAERSGRKVAALFNWGEVPASPTVPPGFGGASEVWTGEPAGETIPVPAHGVRVLVR